MNALRRRRLGLLLIAVGLASVLWAGARLLLGYRAQQRALVALEFLEEGAGQPDSGRTDVAQPEPEPEPGGLVARIEIPRLGVDVAAFEGIGAATLRRGAGHFPGTSLPGRPGNASFAAHRDSFFRRLRRIRTGDEIHVTAPTGAAFVYRASELRVVEPHEVDVVRSRGRAEITLVTCYPFDFVGPAPRRFVVHADLVGPLPTAADGPLPTAPAK